MPDGPYASERVGSASEEGGSLEFPGEVGPEDYFAAHHGTLVRGTFHKVDVVQWDDVEADWQPYETDLSPVELSAKREAVSSSNGGSHEEAPRPPQDLHSCVRLVHQFAARRNWLSPKSSLALAKLCNRHPDLSQSELNALNHLLTRFSDVPEVPEVKSAADHLLEVALG